MSESVIPFEEDVAPSLRVDQSLLDEQRSAEEFFQNLPKDQKPDHTRYDPKGVPLGPYPKILSDEKIADSMRFTAAEMDETRHDISRWVAHQDQIKGRSWWGRSGNSVIAFMDNFMRLEYGQANVAMGIANGEVAAWEVLANFWKGIDRQEGNTPTWAQFYEEHTELDKLKIPLPFTDMEMTGAHVAGFITAVAGDPWTYFNPGSSLNKLGKYAQFATREMQGGRTIMEISDVHKGVREALESGKNLNFSDNVRDQFLRGHRRLNIVGSPFKKPKFTMVKDWRATRLLLQGGSVDDLGEVALGGVRGAIGNTPISALTGAGSAALEASEGGDTGDIIKAGVLGSLLGLETIRMSPGIKLKKMFPNSPVIKGVRVGGKVWNPKIGMAVGEIPILKLPAYEFHGLDQSLPKSSRFAKIADAEMLRRTSEAAFTDMTIKLGSALRNDVPYVRGAIYNVGRIFKRDFRPWHMNAEKHEEIVRELTVWGEATTADQRRHSESILGELQIEKELPDMLNRSSLPFDGTLRPILERLVKGKGTVEPEMAERIYRLMDGPARGVGADYNAGARTLLQILETNDVPSLRYAITYEPMHYEIAIDALEDGMRVQDKHMRWVAEDIARVESGQAPLREAAKTMTPEQSLAALKDDFDSLKRELGHLQEAKANLEGAAEAVGMKRPFLEAPPGVDVPEIPEVELLKLAKDPPTKPDGTHPLPKAPAVRTEGKGVEALQQERDIIEATHKNIQTEIQNTIAISKQGSTVQAVAASRKLDDLFPAERQIRKEARMLDAQMVAAENEVRVGKAKKKAETAFREETNKLLEDTPAAEMAAVDALPDAADDLERLNLRMKNARADGNEMAAAEANQEIRRLKGKSVKDYVDDKLGSLDMISQRQEAKRLLDDAKRAAEMADRAERAPQILSDADKAIEKLDELAQTMRETGQSATGQVRSPVKRPRAGDETSAAKVGDPEMTARDIENHRATVVDVIEQEIGAAEAAKYADELNLDEALLSPEVVWARRVLRNERGLDDFSPDVARDLEDLQEQLFDLEQEKVRLANLTEEELIDFPAAMGRDINPQEAIRFIDEMEIPRVNRVIDDLMEMGAKRRLYRNLEDIGHDEGTVRAQMIPHAYDSLKDLKKVDPDLKPDYMDVRVAGPHRAGTVPAGEPVHGVVFYDGHADTDDLNFAVNSYGPMGRAGGEATGLPEYPMDWTVHRLKDGENPETVLRALSDEPLRGKPDLRQGDEAPSTLSVDELKELADPNVPLDRMRAEERQYLDNLKQKIAAEGIKNPIDITVRDGVPWMIDDGMHRLAVAEELGIDNIPVRYLDEQGNPLRQAGIESGGRADPAMTAAAISSAEDLAAQADDFLEQAEALVGARHHWDPFTPGGRWRKKTHQNKATRLKSGMREWFDANPDATGPEAANLRYQQRRVEAADPSPIRVDGPSPAEMAEPYRHPHPKEPQFDPIRPRNADGTSQVDRAAMPENLQKIPLKIRPPFIQENLELARGATEAEYTYWKLGRNPETTTFDTADDALDAFKEAIKEKGINRAEYAPEADVIEIATDTGDIYQIGLRYEIPQSKISRKAQLANGTFNDLDGLEHYREDFITRQAGAPQLEAYQAAEDLIAAVRPHKGLDDLTQLPEGPVRSEVVKILARLRNAMPDATGSLKVKEIRSEVQKGLKEWLDRFPVEHVGKDGVSQTTRLSPREMGLQIGEPVKRVHGVFRENPYPIGVIVDVDGRMAKVVGYGEGSLKSLKNVRDKKGRAIQFEGAEGDFRFLSTDELQLADLTAATRRGESFWDWATEMSKNDIGVLDRSAYASLIDKAFKKMGLRREAIAQFTEQIIRINPDEQEFMLKVIDSFGDQLDAMWATKEGRQIITAYLPSYAPRAAMEATSAKWATGSKIAPMVHSKFPYAKHRSLKDRVGDLNDWSRVSGARKPYFEEHAGIAMAHYGSLSIEARRKHDFIERIIARNSIPVNEIAPENWDNVIKVMEASRYPKDLIAESRELADDLMKLTGAGDHRSAYDIARVTMANAPAGSPQAELMHTKQIERLMNRMNKIAPPLGIYMPKGALRFYKTNAIPDASVAKGLEAAKLAEELSGEEVQEYLELVNNLWNVGDGEELVMVPAAKINTILAATKRGVPAYMMPMEVADMMNGHFKSQTKFGNAYAPLLKGLEIADNIQKTWVNLTLFPVPVYHFRNMISDLILANQMGHYDLPEYMVDVARMQKTGKGTWKNLFNEEVPWSEVIKAAEDAGVDVAGWSAVSYQGKMADLFKRKTSPASSVIGAGVAGAVTQSPGGAALGFAAGSILDMTELRKAGTVSEVLQEIRKVRPYLNDRNWAMAHAKKVARLGESNRRLALMKKLYEVEGLSLFEAAREANKVFLDFRNLSDTERAFFRRIFPFYSWARQDMPRQAEMLLTRPHTFTIPMKMRNFAEDVVIPDELQASQQFNSPWLQNALPFPVAEVSDGVYMNWLMRSWLPQAQLLDLYEPISAAAGMLTPLIKVFLETGTPLPDALNDKVGGFRGANKNLFFNNPLEDETTFNGREISERDRNLYATFRLVNMWNKMAHNQHLPWYQAAVQHFVGRPYVTDMPELRRWRGEQLYRHQQDLNVQIKIKTNSLERDIIEAEATGKVKEVDLKRHRILELQAELERTEYEMRELLNTPVTRKEAGLEPK